MDSTVRLASLSTFIVRGGGRGYQNGGPLFANLSPRLSLFSDHLRTVLAVKGSLRRAQQRRALDGSGPFRTTLLRRGKGSLRTAPWQGTTSPPFWYPFSPPPTSLETSVLGLRGESIRALFGNPRHRSTAGAGASTMSSARPRSKSSRKCGVRAWKLPRETGIHSAAWGLPLSPPLAAPGIAGGGHAGPPPANATERQSAPQSCSGPLPDLLLPRLLAAVLTALAASAVSGAHRFFVAAMIALLPVAESLRLKALLGSRFRR